MDHPFLRWMDRLYLFTILGRWHGHLFHVADHPRAFSAADVMGTGSQWPEPIAILLMMVFTFIRCRRLPRRRPYCCEHAH